jgi:hypothetical protein
VLVGVAASCAHFSSSSSEVAPDGGDGASPSPPPASDGGNGDIFATSCRDSGGPGIDSCGPDGGESCCATSGVPGGTFLRGYDGVTFVDAGNPATVSAFRLDRFEVTMARFRRFVVAVGAGWRPALGAGKHAHLNGGMGLAVSPADAGTLFESGWDTSQNDALAMVSRPDAGLACGDWTAAPGSNEVLPIGCITWFEAFAFCIWDGGFLPSQAEAAFAAAGGDQQRVFPWSNPPTSTSLDCTYRTIGRAMDRRTAARELVSPRLERRLVETEGGVRPISQETPTSGLWMASAATAIRATIASGQVARCKCSAVGASPARASMRKWQTASAPHRTTAWRTWASAAHASPENDAGRINLAADGCGGRTVSHSAPDKSGDHSA